MMAAIAVLLLGCLNEAHSDVLFDFEEPTIPKEISSKGGHAVFEVSKERYKHGSRSLKWAWSNSGSEVSWDLTTRGISGGRTKNGGIKFHLYNTKARAETCLTMCTVLEAPLKSSRPRPPCISKSPSPFTSCFHVSLDFKGWRTIWVKFQEFLGCPSLDIPPVKCFNQLRSSITRFYIQAPAVRSRDPIYLDFLIFADYMKTGSRDHVVPPIKNADGKHCFACNEFGTVTEKDALKHHDQIHFWDQAYRWDLKSKMFPSPSLLAGPILDSKIEQLHKIKLRVLNWYARKDMSYFDLLWTKPLTRLGKRWLRFLHKGSGPCWRQLGSIECSHILFKDLNIKPSLVGPSLYCRDCNPAPVNSELKFHNIFYQILLPMAIEYHIWSEVELRACALTKKYKCTRSDKNGFHRKDLEAITGKDDSLERVFHESFGVKRMEPSSTKSSFCPSVRENCANRFRDAIAAVNEIRKKRILLLFKYIKDQGFAQGSALGSLDHQLLTGGGYVHAAFIMADVIKNTNDPELSFQDILDTLKWYTDFGEVYQEEFEYKGTTCDRVRTYMLFRLLTVLSMPEETALQKTNKIRDMQGLKRWIDNVFTPSEGTFGFLKPDFLAFHHQFFYAGAYVPEALHVASFISYLLDGTGEDFEFSPRSKANLEQALMVLRDTAVKYSTPSSLNGRYPRYHSRILSKILTAFAYIAVNAPNPVKGRPGMVGDPTLKADMTNIKMFVRLALPSSPICPEFSNVCYSKLGSIMFMNSFGDVQLLEKVTAIAKASSITGESSPQGNWAKNYAALSIHRRNDWAVTVKGFSNFVFDPERYRKENEYGLYGAHGAMLIANSEESLKTKDVNRGWDWRKIPGTTTIDVSYNDIQNIIGSRYSNPRKLAGAVSMIGKSGTKEKANGVFGMDFSMPKYRYKNKDNAFDGKMFEFKKSVFFFNDWMVCLGSDISSTASQNVQTALFQDTVSPSTSESPFQRVFYCNEGGRSTKQDFTGDVNLVDVNGNKYYLSGTSSENLVVHRKVVQKSVASTGVRRESSGTYCTAWIDHGIRPTAAGYEYLIQIGAVSSPHDSTSLSKPDTKTAQFNVLQKSNEAHVVKQEISKSKSRFGYVVFRAGSTIAGEGPLKKVNTDCIIMVEISSNELFVSISYPQMNLKVGKIPRSATAVNPDFCTDGIPTNPISANGKKDKTTALLFCAQDEGKNVTIELRDHFDSYSVISARVDSEKVGSFDVQKIAQISGNVLKIFNLKHGKSTEIKLEM